MKRTIILISITALMVSLSGCSRSRSVSFPEVSLPPASLSIWEKPDASEENPESVSDGLGDPANQSASELVGPALEIYSWFAQGSMPLADQTRVLIDPATGEEETFRLVDSPYFSSYAQLESYLRNFFSEEITQRLLEQYPIFKEVDEELYMRVTDENCTTLLKDIAFSVEETTESSVRLSAAVSDDEDSEKIRRYEFVCEKIDGKWVFTTFANDCQ